eukprot:gene10522-2649_t
MALPLRSVVFDLSDTAFALREDGGTRLLGFQLIGPVRLQKGKIPGVFVSEIDCHCPSTLQVGDQILKVATLSWSRDISTSTLPEALEFLQSAIQTNLVKLVVRLNTKGFLASTKDNLSEHSHKVQIPTPHPILAQRSTVNRDVHNESRHVRDGMNALRENDLEVAEAAFMGALQVTIDPAIEMRLASLARKKNVEQAQKAWKNDLDIMEKQKGYVYYLLGLTQISQHRLGVAQQNMLEATRLLIPWYYHPGLLINLDDPEFHHTIARLLLNQAHVQAAIFALETAAHLHGQIVSSIASLSNDALQSELDFAYQWFDSLE